MARLTGNEAIEYARVHLVTLGKYTDATEEAREGLTLYDAEMVAREDPSLIYVDTIDPGDRVEAGKGEVGTTTYHVTYRDGRHDFTDRAEALRFAAKLASEGWIGDTVRVTEQSRHEDGEPSGEPVEIWSRTRE